MDNIKKARSLNFHPDETSLLIKFVNEEKHILFNKETNKITNDAKNEAWERVTEKFNAVSQRQIKRTKDSLIGLWRKTKGKARTTKALQKRNQFATGGGPSIVESVLPEEQAVFDQTLGILGNIIKPLATNADSDTGYHDDEAVLESEVVIFDGDINELNLATESNVNEPINPSQSKNEKSAKLAFPTGKKRLRPILKSSYDTLNSITNSKMSQMSRAETNETELLEIKRKRFKLDESLSQKYEQLVDENIQYVRDKNKREQELFNVQIETLRTT